MTAEQSGTKRTCAKCGGDLEAGCLLSPSFSAFGVLLNANPASWYAGQPEAGFLGSSLPKVNHPIVAYRCNRCGL